LGAIISRLDVSNVVHKVYFHASDLLIPAPIYSWKVFGKPCILAQVNNHAFLHIDSVIFNHIFVPPVTTHFHTIHAQLKSTNIFATHDHSCTAPLSKLRFQLPSFTGGSNCADEYPILKKLFRFVARSTFAIVSC